MDKLWINGKALSGPDASEMLSPLLGPEGIRSGGGYLFRCAFFADQSLALAICPSFIEGERAYHYNLALPRGAYPELIGTVTEGPTVGALFKERAMDRDKAAAYAALYREMAALFSSCLPPETRLDWATGAILASAGIHRGPCETLGDLIEGGWGEETE